MLTEKEKRMMAHHEQKLSMPPKKFILMYGVIAWGIPVALMYSALSLSFSEKTLVHLMKGELWFNLILFPIGGILYGWLMRKFINRQYQRLKAKETMP